MPVITLDIVKLDESKKAKLAKDMTELASEVMDLPKEAFYVFFREFDTQNIGVGGILLSDKNKDRK